MDPLDFTGRAVVVTGGTRGIGAAIAAAFQAAGADVLICGRTPPDPAPSAVTPTATPSASAVPPVAAAPSASGSSVAGSSASASRPPVFFQADVRDPAQAAALINAAIDRFGRVDVLVNNAGGSPEVPAGSASPRLHAKIIELNLIAPLHVAQAANAVMREQSTGGVILMIGSVSGTRPSPGTAAYGAAKAGLHHLATSLAAEWAPRVRVNTLVVGPVEAAPMSRPGPSGFAASGPAATGAHGGRAGAGGPAASTVARTVPMGRPAAAGEVASACLLLASPLAGYISGASLAVHGGGEWPAYLADLRDTAYRADK
ncbi:SDR family NAD(P)-dependent oxidoreductase [Actinoplanes xinjiangensis]|uniref:SDR family NAD(P)-dependent oxidoreductase n=1 Tax=Actinoplanes xinjiangensis TaxID=512350 RepID=UPI00343FC0B4